MSFLKIQNNRSALYAKRKTGANPRGANGPAAA
jgi:hypothetical protein